MERRHPDAKCEECPWYQTSEYAGGDGPVGATLAFIGEAPGRVETETGVPFSGPSGILLERVLRSRGIERADVYMDNVAACHPPFRGGQKATAPPKEVRRACWPRLKAELDARPIETIVTLGNTAKEQILDTREGITSVRVGPPKSSPRFPGVRIIPTIHPAATLRNSDAFPDLAKDIAKINQSGEVLWREPAYVVYDDPRQAVLALRELASKYRHKPVAVDIETGVEKDGDFTHPDVLLCVGFGYEADKVVVIGDRACQNEGVRKALRTTLEAIDVYCHNGKYDIQVLMRLGILDNPYCLKGDTMLMSYCLDERPGHHGLGVLGVEILGTPDWKDEGPTKYIGKGESYAKAPRDVLYKYNAFDCAVTRQLIDYFTPRLEAQDLMRVHDRLIRYSHEIIYIELDGVRFDLDYNKELIDTYLEELKPLEDKLRPWVENPRSWQQITKALAEMGIRVPDTQKDTLKLVLERGVQGEAKEFLELLLEYKDQYKQYSTYVIGLRKRTVGDRLYSTFLLHGSVTGRTASRNPNLQNVDRREKIRRQFIPAEGSVFVQADYKAIELRVIAVESGDVWLSELFADDSRDIHNEISLELFGPGFTKEQRVKAKAVVYGLGYGREAYSLAMEHRMSEREAQAYLDAFFAKIPQVVDWRERVMLAARSSQGLTTVFGRKRRFWLVTRENLKDVQKEALAFIPQSTANDINLTALCELRQHFHGTEVAFRQPVHDSIMAECPEGMREEVAETMKTMMEETARRIYSDKIRFPVDVEFGKSWGDLVDE